MTLQLSGVRLPLAHFDLDISADLSGRVTGIFGVSGAGKTSLLDIVAGLRLPQAGRITLDDVVIEDSAAGIHIPARHRRIGYVTQENSLFPHMTVLQNIRYGAGDAPTGRVIDVLEIGYLLKRGVTALSGGEQKRVALARALVTSPKLLLLDEPLAGLDRPLHGRITAFLQRVRDELQVPMLYVTHDPAELAEMAEETVVLERAKVIAVGKTSDVVRLVEQR